MKLHWKKLGKIFDPRDHQLPQNCEEFAQSPQGMVLQDRIRIFFCAREREPSGKFLSYPLFVDFDKELTKILQVADKPVLPLGDLGTFDEHGVFPLNIVPEGNRVLGYTSGWFRRESVLVDSAIGLAVSHDNGLSFERVGPGPVLGPSLHEPYLIADPFVLNVEGVYHMWYVYGTRWMRHDENVNPDRVYKIGLATSADGENWQKEGRQILPDGYMGDVECQALPTVTKIGERYHMYFCYRHAIGFREQRERGYRLGYAYSDDLTHWTRADEIVGIERSEEGWDSEMMCYPFLLPCEDRVYLLYNGNAFGRDGFGAALLDRIEEGDA